MRFRIPSRPRIAPLRLGRLRSLPAAARRLATSRCFKALLKGVIERGGVDRDFVARPRRGLGRGRSRRARRRRGRRCSPQCGLARADVDRAVDAIVSARRGIFLWAMGLTHHEHGVDNVERAREPGARARLGRARGLRAAADPRPQQRAGRRLGRLHAGAEGRVREEDGGGLRHPCRRRRPASTPTRAWWRRRRGGSRVAVLLGGNLFGSNPDRAWARSALQRIGTTASITTKLNEGHVHGRGRFHVVLPVLARDEETQATTQESMFNYVRLSDGGEAAPEGEIRSEVEVDLRARRAPAPARARSRSSDDEPRRGAEAIAKVVPGYAPIAAIGATRREFQIDGRTFHDAARSRRPRGRRRRRSTPLPAFRAGPGEFRLMTLRSRGAVQHRRLRGRGPLPRHHAARRRDDERGRTRAASGPARGRSRRRRHRRSGGCASSWPSSTSRRGTSRCTTRRRTCSCRGASIADSGTPAFKSIVARLEPVRGVTLPLRPRRLRRRRHARAARRGQDGLGGPEPPLHRQRRSERGALGPLPSGKLSYAEWVALDIESWRDAGATRDEMTGSLRRADAGRRRARDAPRVEVGTGCASR